MPTKKQNCSCRYSLRVNILVIFSSIITIAMVISATYLAKAEYVFKRTILKNTPPFIIILRSALREKAVLVRF